MNYLIQGVFFQNFQQLGVIYRSEAEGGAGVAISEAVHRFMFSGCFFPDPDDKVKLIGEMFDLLGDSVLFGVEITPKIVRFLKKYRGRQDFIEYTFKRQGKMWVGKYSGALVGTGGAKCVITEVSDEFFLPPKPTKKSKATS